LTSTNYEASHYVILSVLLLSFLGHCRCSPPTVV